MRCLLILAPLLPMAWQASPALAAAAPTNPLWRAAKVRNYLPDMTWPEVQELLTRTDMVIIPVPALEQHGPQGPIGTDFYNGTEEAKLIAQRTDALVAPVLMVGNSPYHMGFAGTMTLSTETLERVYFEAAQSLIQHGFRRFVFLNAHGGNAATTRFVVDRINQETAATAVDLDEAMRPYLDDEHTPPAIKAEADAFSDPKELDQHAGVSETSKTMYLAPSLVEVDKAPPPRALTLPTHLRSMVPRVGSDPTTTLLFLSEALKAKSTGKGTSTREMTFTGVWSEADTRRASAARGKAIVDGYVEAAIQFIVKWKSEVPMHARSE